MEIRLGQFAARHDTPAQVKFAWPLLLLPELFADFRHLSLLVGYLESFGWEVFALDLFGAQSAASLTELIAQVVAAHDALGRDVIALGHGVGGLVALKLAEHSGVRAGVALAPITPRGLSPLVSGVRNTIALRMGARLRPPSGRLLFELVADAHPFEREALIRKLQPAASQLVRAIARDELKFNAGAPKAIINGDSDVFAPLDRVKAFSARVGAELAILRGRGHWLVGGRALERTMAEFQRFIVRNLGEDLLLLYPGERE